VRLSSINYKIGVVNFCNFVLSGKLPANYFLKWKGTIFYKSLFSAGKKEIVMAQHPFFQNV